jgi:hypothetical protein
MPRGDHKIEDTPYRVWLVEVDEYNRIRVPLSEITTVVPWLKDESESLDCVGTPGPAGGVQIEPRAAQETLARRYIEALGGSLVESSESGKQWVETARLLATGWRLVISVEKTRINITLPEPMRKARLVPEAGALAVVFGFGEILEVWDAARWHDHVRIVAGTKASGITKAIEDIYDR